MEERYYTVPNLITFYRFLSALFIFSALFVPINKWLILAVYVVAVITDKIDGIVARRLKQESKFGEVLESTTDTLLSGVILAYVVIKFNFPLRIFLVLFFLFIVGLIIATIYFVLKKDWYSESLITSKISALITYLACFVYFFELNFRYYFALVALLAALIAFVNYLYHIINNLVKKDKKI
jgi:phosphatidylglycerophosphate synthase